MVLSLVFHVPHASTTFPPGRRADLLVDDRDLHRELLVMTDHHVDRLFRPAAGEGDGFVLFPWSRLLVDPERFRDGSLEAMAAKGMGAVYTRTHDGMVLRKEPLHRDELLAE